MKKEADQIVRKMKLQTLLYTNVGAKPLQAFLKTTGIATRRWILGLQRPKTPTNPPPQDYAKQQGFGTVAGVEEEHGDKDDEEEEIEEEERE
jgi:hypothetical protein